MRWIVVATTLFGYWLVLSGHYYLWLVALGAALSVVIALYLHFTRITDPEGFPVRLIPRGLIYWPWLAWQIVLSALQVTRVVLGPRRGIRPAMVRVDALQQTPEGIAIYANSITLTPGTLSVEVSYSKRAIWVHALEQSSAEDMKDDEMNRRAAWMETGDSAGAR